MTSPTCGQCGRLATLAARFCGYCGAEVQAHHEVHAGVSDIDPAELTDEQIRAVMAEAGRRGASKRAKGERVCVACGAVIPEALSSRRYCSDACRCRAGYWRKKGRVTDDPAAPFVTTLAGKGQEDARSYTRRKPVSKRKRA
jgi:predicted nucleic acid-binding Zn ribbon protein